VENLKETLFKLLNDEIDNLHLGHYFNKDRLQMMREICHLLTYYKYVDMSDSDILKIVKFYEY
jgi:hypothetical protein